MDQSLETTTSPKRRAKFLVGGALLVVAVPVLIVWALGRPGAASFYVTVSEAKARGVTSQDYRVNGTVVPGSIERDGLVTTFRVTDGDTEMAVSTDRPLPDTFKDESEVVVKGDLEGSTFVATEVLAKCPSKFKAKRAA
jgi:cytochrome c-type biogenesis protein CcmE